MCFTIHEEHLEVKIATEDITCYKIFLDNARTMPTKREHITRERFEYRTPFQQCLVKKEALMVAEIKPSYFDRAHELSYGIHSLTSLKAATSYRAKYEITNRAVFAKCTIPKGSEYYYNPDTNQYISNQLQLGEEIKNIRTQKILNFIANLFNNLK